MCDVIYYQYFVKFMGQNGNTVVFFVDRGLFILYSRARSKHAIRSGSDILIYLHVTHDPNNTLQNEVLMSCISKPNYIIEF